MASKLKPGDRVRYVDDDSSGTQLVEKVDSPEPGFIRLEGLPGAWPESRFTLVEPADQIQELCGETPAMEVADIASKLQQLGLKLLILNDMALLTGPTNTMMKFIKTGELT